MTWFIFLWALTLGAEQSDMLVGYDPNLVWYGYTTMQASLLIADTLEVDGSETIRIRPSRTPFFAPIEGEFMFFVKLQYKPFSVGWEHACYHNFQGYYTRDLQGYDRLFVTIGSQR